MMSRVLRFQIRHHTGHVEQLNVEAERALIGSGAHCEIRLPVDQARVEHVLVEVGPAGVFALALSFEPPPTINDIPFTQAPLPAGAILGVGGCQIFVELADEVASGAGRSKKKTSPLSLLLVLIMLPAAGYLLLSDDEGVTAVLKAPRDVPELWGPPITACSHTGEQALAFAQERVAVADAKRERRPFHVQDGVQAVPIYESAAACFRVGRDHASGQLADDAAKFLRREMTDDFRTRRVRLEHTLKIEDYVSAQKEVRVLLQFTEGKSGKYVEWLSNLDRRLKAKIGAKKS